MTQFRIWKRVFWFSLVLAPAYEASGGIVVWYEAVPLTPNAFVDEQGGVNHSNNVELRCDKSAGDCSWNITAQLRIGSGYSTDYDLYLRDPAGDPSDLMVSGTSVAGAPWSVATTLIENGTGGMVSRVRARTNPPGTQIPASASFHFMHSFVLTKTGQALSGTTVLFAGSQFGFGGFEPINIDDVHIVRVGFNPSLQPGWIPVPMEWANPVITITNTPEPGTAGLMVVGAMLAKLRGRRPCLNASRQCGRRSGVLC